MPGTVLLLLIMIIYPFIIAKLISKYTYNKENINVKHNIKNMAIIIFLSSIFTLIIFYLLNIYDGYTPTSSSYLCSNSGGFTYSCKGDLIHSLIIFIIIELVIIIYHILTLNFLYPLFKYKGIIKYIFTYILLIFNYVISFFILLFLYGLFLHINFDNGFVKILRFLVLLSPTLLFTVSTIIYIIKNKK